MKEIINCAAYAGGQRLADVELNRVHDVLRETDKFVWIGLHDHRYRGNKAAFQGRYI